MHAPRQVHRTNPSSAERNSAIPRGRSNHRQAARQLARDSLSSQLWTANKYAVTYLFKEDGFYEKLADRLIESQPWARRASRGHWLCKQLRDAAEGLDPGTYAEQAGSAVRDGLRNLGLPPFMADTLGASSGVALKIAFDKTPVGDLSKVLCALIPLVCPNINRCPAESKVITTFISPALADHLKEMVGNQ